jgi:hypothetical protein
MISAVSKQTRIDSNDVQSLLKMSTSMALDNITVTANTRTFLARLKKNCFKSVAKLSTRDHNLSTQHHAGVT